MCVCGVLLLQIELRKSPRLNFDKWRNEESLDCGDEEYVARRDSKPILAETLIVCSSPLLCEQGECENGAAHQGGLREEEGR